MRILGGRLPPERFMALSAPTQSPARSPGSYLAPRLPGFSLATNQPLPRMSEFLICNVGWGDENWEEPQEGEICCIDAGLYLGKLGEG